ncbi:MAG: holin, BlyA family protein [Lachnospiraceae bacterium]|nr:holin, BlyA family protein [Lachnospiraceae bacterium]
MKEALSRFKNDNSGIGVVELVLILVILIALVVIFKNQITRIVTDAFNSITNNADTIIN